MFLESVLNACVLSWAAATYRYAICYFGRGAPRPRATTAVARIQVRIDPEVEGYPERWREVNSLSPLATNRIFLRFSGGNTFIESVSLYKLYRASGELHDAPAMPSPSKLEEVRAVPVVRFA
jgi:hypothetical protein